MKKLFALVSASFIAVTVFAQASKEEIMADIHNMGYVYAPYPDVDHPVSAYPKGYVPFHIEHLGRHGSRNLDEKDQYTNSLKLLQRGDSLGVLTPLGRQLMGEIQDLISFAEGRYGMLVPRGEREHRHIIDRMYRNYPEVFSTKHGRTCWVDASSTKVFRTMMSMSYGLDELKTLNPKIRTTRATDERTDNALYRLDGFRKVQGEVKEIKSDYPELDPSRLMGEVFTDFSFIPERKQRGFVRDIWRFAFAAWMNSDDYNQDFFKYLRPEEVYPIWVRFNKFMFLCHGPSTKYGKIVTADLVPLLKSMMDAEAACFNGRGPDAGLHYAHDIHVMPLAALMGIKGCCEPEKDPDHVHEVWCDYIVSPMATNIQLVFFRSKKTKDNGDVLVKVLMNEKESSFDGLETDNWPYYKWSDVKAHFEKRMNGEL